MGTVNSSFNPAEPKTKFYDDALESDGIVTMKFTKYSAGIKDESNANQPSNATVTVKQMKNLLSDPEKIHTIAETQTSKQPVRRQEEGQQERNAIQLDEKLDNGIISSSTNNPYKFSKRKKDYKRTIATLEAEVRQLREEKQTMFTRLGEIGSLRFTENNPNIADLSDANRPEKLAEQFSELYDNEWTDAFEYLTEVDDSQEKETVRRLLNILQEIYIICLESTRTKADDLKEKMLAYVGFCDEVKDELVIMETEKKLREYREKNLDLYLDRVTKDVRQQLEVQLEGKVHDSLDQYIQKCTRVCWLMCIKSPQMHIDFGNNPIYEGKHDGANDVPLQFDTTKFASYTCKGMYLEYVVWPAMYLYKDGPIIKRGVAQGLNTNIEKTESTENEIGENYNSSGETYRQEYKGDYPNVIF